jgi:hypothetical protein
MEIARLQDSFSHRVVLPCQYLPCHAISALPRRPASSALSARPMVAGAVPPGVAVAPRPASSLGPFRQADLLQLPSPRDGRGAPSGPRAGLAASDRPRPGHR